MSIRQIFLVSGLALAAPWGVQAQVTTPAPIQTSVPNGTMVTLVQTLQAARNNLDVTLAHSALSAARADVQSADRAPFPVLSGKLGSMDLQNGLGGGSWATKKRVDKSVGVDWTWERGDKRALRTLTAQRAALAAQADLEDTTALQLQAAYAAFFDLLAAQEREQQVAALAHSAAQLSDTATRRVQAGDMSAQEAARTDIEAQRAQADWVSATLERQRAALALGQITGWTVPADTLSAHPDWPVTAPVPSTLPDPTALALLRPDVRAAQARVQAAQAALDSASALKRADVTWGASIDHFPGTSTRQLELRMQMPLQWGYDHRGEVGRAQAQLTQAQDLYEKVLRAASAEMQRLQLEGVASAARANRYHTDILPRARSVAAGAELAYRHGALSLSDLLDARRTLRATLIEAFAARADAAKAAGAWQLRVQPETFLSSLSSTESSQ